MHIESAIPEGLCQCGCGLPTAISEYGDKRRGIAPGEHYKFARTGHNKRKFVSTDGRYLCRRCKGLFEEGDIYRDTKPGRVSDIGFCKNCATARAKEHKEKYPVQRKLTATRATLREKYGITVDDYLEMYEAQAGRCAICRTQKLSRLEINTRAFEVLHVDHCHATGQVRGLLCVQCNHGLGRFLDDPNKLRAAADYLERSKE